MKHIQKLPAFLLALFLASASARAADRTWSPGTSDWGTGGVGGNWSGAAVPTTSDNAIFGSAETPTNPDLAGNFGVGALDIDNTQGDYQIAQTDGPRTLTIARGIVDGIANTAFRIVGGGTTTVAPHTTFTGGTGTSTFVFNLFDVNANRATLNLNGLSSFTNTGARSVGADNGTLNFNGGILANNTGNDGRTFLPTGNGTILIDGYSRTDVTRGSQISTVIASFTGVLALAGNIDARNASGPAILHAGGTLELRTGMALTAGQTITWTSNTDTVLRAGSGGNTIANTVNLATATGSVNTTPDSNFRGELSGTNSLTFNGDFNVNSTNPARQTFLISNTGKTTFSTLNIGNNSNSNRHIALNTSAANVVVEVATALQKQNAGGIATLSKLGAGTLILGSGATATYTGTTTVEAGTYLVNGDASGAANSYIVESGASLGGHGLIGGQISGAGLVAPGNSPGILTAPSVNGTAGTDFAFEFTQAGDPTWNTAAASGNDVLRLTAATPFTNPLGAGNELRLYFADAGTYRGGFFTDNDADFSASVDDATFLYFIEWEGGPESHGGKTYNALPASFVTRDIVQIATADFAGPDANNGWTMEFAVAIPEPGSLLLVALGLAVFGLTRFRRR